MNIQYLFYSLEQFFKKNWFSQIYSIFKLKKFDSALCHTAQNLTQHWVRQFWIFGNCNFLTPLTPRCFTIKIEKYHIGPRYSEDIFLRFVEVKTMHNPQPTNGRFSQNGYFVNQAYKLKLFLFNCLFNSILSSPCLSLDLLRLRLPNMS